MCRQIIIHVSLLNIHLYNEGESDFIFITTAVVVDPHASLKCYVQAYLNLLKDVIRE